MEITFRGDDIFFRRVMHYYILEGGKRIASSAFKKRSKKPDQDCSVYLKRLMASPDEPMRKALPNQRLIQFKAGVPMSLGIELSHDPIPDEPSHCTMKIETNAQCDALAAQSSLYSRASSA